MVADLNAFIGTDDAAEAQGGDQGLPEDLHREPLRHRADRLSGGADHQQALLEHPAGHADQHVQLGRGQHHPRAGVRRGRPADRTTSSSRTPCPARRAATGRSRSSRRPRTGSGPRGRPVRPRAAERRGRIVRHAALPRDADPRVDPGARHHEHHHLRDHPGAAGRLRRLHPQHDDHPGPRHQRRGRCRRRSSTASSTGSTTRCTCSTSAGSGAWSPAATSATASTTTSRSPRWSPSACRAPSRWR